MESRIGSIGQREMIARLLHDSDFADPVFVDPAEYSNNSSNNRGFLNLNVFNFLITKIKMSATPTFLNVKTQIIQTQQFFLMMNVSFLLLNL